MKIVLYMAMTVNGIIARENDETPWSDAEWKAYISEVKKIRTLIVGRRTYEIMKESDNFKKLGNPFVIVLTKMKVKNRENFAFVSSVDAAIELVKKKKISRVLLGGGSTTNTEFIKRNLVDEMIVDVEPIIFGSGIPLFKENYSELNLKLLNTKKISKNEVQLHYRVVK